MTSIRLLRLLAAASLVGPFAFSPTATATKLTALPDESPFPPDPTNPRVVDARLELEFRRVGGPRREAVESLLVTGLPRAGFNWIGFARRACREGLVDCVMLRRHASDWAAARSDLQRPFVKDSLKSLDREVYLRSLSQREWRALLERAARGGQVHLPDGHQAFDYGEAVRRILAEGQRDLEEEARRTVQSRPGGSLRPVAEQFELADLERGKDGANALVRLVLDGLRMENQQTEAGVFKDSPDPKIRMAMAAIDRLRLRPPPQGLEELSKGLREVTEGAARTSRSWGSARPLACKLAELVGDLGDRKTEMSVLGDKCLSSRVATVESKLVEMKLLRREERVSDDIER
jgi:hypothetical protein